MEKPITISNYEYARKHKRDFDAIITIEDPNLRHGVRFTKEPKKPQLVLKFEDLDEPQKHVVCITREQVEQALEFAREFTDKKLLVHCQAGVSRSTGIALSIISDRLGAGQEKEAVEKLLELRPEAVPNFMVVAYADAILERSGALLTAVIEAEQGLEYPEKTRLGRAEFYKRHPEAYVHKREDDTLSVVEEHTGKHSGGR